jgi:hypothetical protein
MKVIKTSSLSGIEHVVELDITYEELIRVENRFHTKELIQNIVPKLTSGEREFLKSGITEKEWENTFGKID